MGTNYYLHKNGSDTEILHIGKSSAGWCFSLHIDENEGINDLDDWMPLFNDDKNIIKNEYGDLIPANEMVEVITDRSWPNRNWDEPPPYFMRVIPPTWEEFHVQNHSERGPNGLLRHKIDPYGYHCVKHGSGTWDCIKGDFS